MWSHCMFEKAIPMNILQKLQQHVCVVKHSGSELWRLTRWSEAVSEPGVFPFPTFYLYFYMKYFTLATLTQEYVFMLLKPNI